MSPIINAFNDEVEVEIPENYADLMEKPLQLITMDPEKGCCLDKHTCDLLKKLDTPIVVVGIAGTSRTGKSHLMNLLAGKKTGSTITSQTRGIWIWCRPHPILADTTLILMDTDGLDDPEKSDPMRDMNIIVLSLLLSSTFIYNTMSSVGINFINQLGFVSELTNYIRVRSGEDVESGTDFDLYFPVLVLTARDFCLRLEIDGEQITAGQYFEHCLVLRESKGDSRRREFIANYNDVRIKIRKYFPQRRLHCYVLPAPVKILFPKNLDELSVLPKEELNPEFLQEYAKYQEFILSLSPKKMFRDQDLFNGRMFVDMVESYVAALQADEIPCIRSTLKLTAENENRRLLQECVEKYKAKMNNLNFPVTLEALTTYHNEVVANLTLEYKEKLIFAEWHTIQHEFNENFKAAYNNFIKLNQDESREQCTQILKSLGEGISDHLINKKYCCPDSCDIFTKDLNDLKAAYPDADLNAVKREALLTDFMGKKDAELRHILAIKESITVNVEKLEETLRKSLEDSAKMIHTEWKSRFEQKRYDYERIIADRHRNYDDMTSELKDEIEELRPKLWKGPENSLQIDWITRYTASSCNLS